MKVELRKPLLSDAKRYFEILNHPDFLYFPVKPATIKEEKDFLRDLKEMIKKKVRFSFAVTANGKHVGATGLKINQRYPYIPEIKKLQQKEIFPVRKLRLNRDIKKKA